MSPEPTLDVDAEQAKFVRVVDMELTGLPDAEGTKVCEIGFIDVNLDPLNVVIDRAFTSLVDPGIPMPPQARAIHHISDKDLEGAPKYGEGMIAMGTGLRNNVLCAHNAECEKTFYKPTGVRWVDTFKCALRAWPDAPGHSNQTLRYFLGLDEMPGFDMAMAMPPHRALPDAYVTALMLVELLKLRPLDRLIEISAEPAFYTRITFGKHSGTPFADIPTGYLEWMIDQKDMDAGMKFTAKWNLQRRGKR